MTPHDNSELDMRIESLWFAAQKYTDLNYGTEHQMSKDEWEAKAQALLTAEREKLLDELEKLPTDGNRSLSVLKLRDFIASHRKEQSK